MIDRRQIILGTAACVAAAGVSDIAISESNVELRVSIVVQSAEYQAMMAYLSEAFAKAMERCLCMASFADINRELSAIVENAPAELRQQIPYFEVKLL